MQMLRMCRIVSLKKALNEAKNRTDFSDAYETPEEFMKAMQELANA